MNSHLKDNDIIDLTPVDGVYVAKTTTGAASDRASTDAPLLPTRPNMAFMLRHPAHMVALGFGSGLAPFAPGTFGTLWGWVAFSFLQNWLNPFQMGMLIAASIVVGWWACTLTARHMGVMDPGSIVWDQIVAIWLILWLVTPTTGWGEFGAFLLFRYFDAAKPGPVRWADQLFKGFGWRGGWGIVFDDVVAAFCTLLVIAVWRW
ncbi:MAG: phosphatidylglycerophosphatase A [Betaproteobacteria bacterium]|nr:phosphatidylglycerophosphatase A [Betaproteobacteria bacterium]